MTCIEAVSSYLPPEIVSVEDYLAGYGFSPSRIKVYERYFGFSEIRMAPQVPLSEQLVAAASKLPELQDRKSQVRYVLQSRTMPVAAPYPLNPLHEARDALGLQHAQAFCVTQHACASGLLAVDLAGKLLAADGRPDGLALVLAGEKTFTDAARVIIDTGIMGEGAVAVLVGLEGDQDRLLGYATKTMGEFAAGAWLPPEVNALFHDIYADTLAEVIIAAVECADLVLDEIALILPHNVNRMSWLKVLRKLGMRGTDRIFLDNLPVTGHCFGADPFINLKTASELGRLQPGDHYLMTAVGLGATFSAMVFRR